ncbi:MAG: hypothetical protein Q9172_007688 [Xanthocarpia lactea]
MALVLASNAPLEPDHNLAQAIDDYEKILSAEERIQLHAQGPPDALAALNFTATMDREYNSRGRRCMLICWFFFPFSSKHDKFLAFPHRLLVSFDQEFGHFETELGQLCQEIQLEASLASKQAQKQENELQARERSRAGKSRSLIARISDNLDKSNMEDEILRLKIDRRNLKKKKLQALDSLSTYDYQKTYKQTRKECILGTSDWILEESKFKTWKEGNSRGLWCSGKCKYLVVVNDFEAYRMNSRVREISHKMMESMSPNDVISFFFCRFDDQESLKARTIVGSIARQFVDDIPEDNFRGFCNDIPVIEYLEIALSHTRQYFIILDGLDECSEVEIREVSEDLHRLLSSPRVQIKIFWFSRPNVVDWLPSKLKTEQQISLETTESQDRIASDIREFIKSTLEEWLEGDTPKLRILDPTTALTVVRYLKKEAHGIEKKSDQHIIDTLKHLPRDLPQTFERILARFTETEDVDIGRRIFRWAAVAKRPLTLQEIREAIGIAPLQDTWNAKCFINDIKKAVACCGNLIFIDEEQQTIHFTHSSVKQYLLSRPANKSSSRYHIDLEDADADAGAICVTYLNLPAFNKQIMRTPKANLSTAAITSAVIKGILPVGNSANKIALRILRHRDQSNKSVQRLLEEAAEDTERTRRSAVLEQYSFYPYAQRFWLDHTKKGIAPDSGKLWRLWFNLLKDAHWRDTLSSQPWTFEDLKEGYTNIVQWVVENNHCSLARLLVERELARGTRGTRGILIEGAAAMGFTELTEIALSSRNISHTILNSSLKSAAKGGHLAVVERLLQERADVDTWTALEAAAGGGHLAVVERLLQGKAHVEIAATVLQAAARGGHLAVVERLLQEKADVNAAAAALKVAAGRGHLPVVERLLQGKAHVEIAATVLQAAARGGHLAVVERLLQEKADVNAAATSQGGRTALQAAAEGGHLAVVERLLQVKADVNADAATYFGRTALQAAAKGGHLAVVERLLQEKADVNADAGTYSGLTALQAAAKEGHLAVVERLLQEKADVNADAATYSGLTALEAAAGGGYLAVVERLLQEKADINVTAPRLGGRTALQAAVAGGHRERPHVAGITRWGVERGRDTQRRTKETQRTQTPKHQNANSKTPKTPETQKSRPRKTDPEQRSKNPKRQNAKLQKPRKADPEKQTQNKEANTQNARTPERQNANSKTPELQNAKTPETQKSRPRKADPEKTDPEKQTQNKEAKTQNARTPERQNMRADEDEEAVGGRSGRSVGKGGRTKIG